MTDGSHGESPAVLIGESFAGAGAGAEAAHVVSVLGHRPGPAGTARVTELAARADPASPGDQPR
jgi:formaldehyde-activating enzyme involved in methanogenesis